MEKYRCSCCDRTVPVTTQVYKAWTTALPKEETPIVRICRKCNAAMRRAGVDGVYEFYYFEKGRQS